MPGRALRWGVSWRARLRGVVAAAGVVLLSSGCEDRPAPRMEPPAPAAAADPPPQRDRIAMRHWPAQGPERAVILALHGFGDSGELTFAPAANAWAARGIAIYAPDQRGFGANITRKQWPGARRLVEDARVLAQIVRERHPDRPLIIVGHSMGGGVGLAAAGAGMRADGLVLAAPAIAGRGALNPVGRLGAWALATLLPERRWSGEGLPIAPPSDNDAAMRAVSADPRHFATPSSRELYGLVRVMDLAAKAAPHVTIPTLTLIGANDAFLLPARVRGVHDRIPGGIDFRVYPQGWHWLFRDLQAPRVWEDVADFAVSLADE